MWFFMTGVAAYICVYTISYGVWEWKNNNKSAAIAVCALALITLAIPVFKIFS